MSDETPEQLLGRRASDNGPMVENLKKAARVSDDIGKVFKPVWATFVTVVVGAFMIGRFYFEWQYTVQNGSPAMQLLLANQQKQIDNQQLQLNKLQSLIELQQQRLDLVQAETVRRLNKIEESK